MRLLFLSPRESWPPNSGAKLRDYHLASSLACGAQFSYLFFGSDRTAAELAQNFASGSRVFAAPPPPKYTLSKIVAGLTGRYPLPVRNYTSEEMMRLLSDIGSREAFDIVHLDSIHFAAYLPLLRRLLPQAKVVLNWHNIESELMDRYAESTNSLPRKIYAKITAGQMRKLEALMLRSCYGHIVCSERDRETLSERNGVARVALVPNGVDTAYFSPVSGQPLQERLLFVGQMSYHANADGIAWFVREIWPAIRSSPLAFQLSIVGSSPSPATLALANEPGIEVTGTVPDVRPFYSGAYAAIVPLLTGGGTRLKILEAMAAGTPVISTRLGAEGLPVADRQEILFAGDDKGSWLDALEFLADGERRQGLVDRARRLAVSRFDWSAIGEDLLRLYEVWSRAEA